MDVALVVLLRFITREPVQTPMSDTARSGCSAIVRSARWLARTSAFSAGLSSGMWIGIHRDADGGDLNVITQAKRVEPLLLGDLFR